MARRTYCPGAVDVVPGSTPAHMVDGVTSESEKDPKDRTTRCLLQGRWQAAYKGRTVGGIERSKMRGGVEGAVIRAALNKTAYMDVHS